MQNVTMELERDVYSRCLNIAKSYYTLIRRRKELETELVFFAAGRIDGMPRSTRQVNPTAEKAERILDRRQEIDRKIHAVERALDACTDTYDRQLIQKNLFEQVPLAHLDLPMSERTMKRRRKAFLVNLAENLDEI